MKFTILSHAGMLVEHDGVSLVLDPWLIGSCYWRSWWNFPEPEDSLVRNLRPNFVYLTHLHWDHFHGSSLRRFSPDTTILVPKAITSRMVDDLRWLGFQRIVEIPHGTEYKLTSDFSLFSYQFGTLLDSSAVVRGGGVTLLDANDCKSFGYPLRSLLRRFPSIDFVFRSHSSASGMPYCIEGYEKKFPELRTRSDYEEEFARFAVYCRAKHAVPFASNHCFLHRETKHFNATAVTPLAAASRCNALSAECQADTKAVIMTPGSSWDAREGFHIVPFDFDNRDAYIEKLQLKYADKLATQYDIEAAEHADFESFVKYFNGFVHSIPFFLRSRWAHEIAFRVVDPNGQRYWVVDVRNRSVTEREAPPESAVIIETPAKVLNDCTQIKMFSVWTPSKRLKVFLDSEAQRATLGSFFTYLDAFELEAFPLRKLCRPRPLSVIARRWRELVEGARIVIGSRIFHRPFVYRDVYPVAAMQAQPVSGNDMPA